ncbi:hypothetical protein SuNHUV7_33790 (plasmid) [Pseudoseohaeicola sp. NH-UV-7]|uniref:FkbM family methyltransferase n=1 Tax=Sulfitobacter sp. TBRI5 TaxID=2989732 RepID=UPI003A6E0464
MGITSIARPYFLHRGYMMQKMCEPDLVLSFIERFKSKLVPVDLIRIGGDADGGYLVPDDMQGIASCFSPGVDYTATFENAIASDYGIKCFMADASVEKPPLYNALFEFDAKFLGARDDGINTTLSSWIAQKNPENADDMLLQMDIEGFEYDVLVETPSSVLRQFRTMIIEFHAFDKLFDREFLRLANSVFEKIYKDFSIAHVHPNNCCGIARHRGAEIPRVFEVTFIRNDRVSGCSASGPVVLPHALDRKNLASEPDIVMPDMWWK